MPPCIHVQKPKIKPSKARDLYNPVLMKSRFKTKTLIFKIEKNVCLFFEAYHYS